MPMAVLHLEMLVALNDVGCPECHVGTCTVRLKNGKKTCYMGHRRFLDADHSLRSDDKIFDGTEFREAPTPRTGKDILRETENLNVVFGKDPSGKSKSRRKKGDPPTLWKKRSIFFRLPYWKELQLHHNFDVMHIEKNVCDNIVNTLLGIDGRTKDNLNYRLDLAELGLRKDL